MAMDIFKWALFSYYIFIGTTQVMLMKASGESAKGTGKGLAYNTAFAMVLIEGLKILCCFAVEAWQGDECRAENGEARKTSTWAGWVVYAVPGFLYSVENNLKIPATVYLDPHVFALFNNSKVIFAAIGMVILLGKRFSVLQWMSMALLGLSLCVAKVHMMLPVPASGSCAGQEAAAGSHHPEEQSSSLFLLGIILVLSASVISGLAGVSNELLLKKRDTDVGLWRKNIWTYQWGVIFNSIGFLSSSLRDTSSFSLLRGFDVWVWAMVIVTALLGISVSMIMKYFDNIVKCFGGSLILYSTTVASMLIFGSRIDAGFVLGLAVYSISSFFYAGDHNKKLDVYDKYSSEIEKLVEAKERGTKELQALTKDVSDAADETDSKGSAGEPKRSVVGRSAAR